jgi:outer membrane protein OmpA-like peptidoglycan-associated protein
VLAQRGAYRTLTLTGLRFAAGAGAFDSSGRPLLDRVCAALAREAGATFMVEAHVDPSGDADADLTLSQDRANSVRGYLVQQCRIPQERVLSMGYAASLPVAANDTAEGRAMNRRIVIEIQPPTP